MQTTSEQELLQACYGLTSCQARQGDWSAFNLRPGGSSLWTTAAALTALGHGLLQITTRPRWLARSYERGWDYLIRAKEGEPIGFNPLTPPDADSTVWLARALGQRLRSATDDQSPTRDAGDVWLASCLDYIREHVCADGERLSTYNRSDGILGFVGRPDHATSHWLSPHPCVSANGRRLGQELSQHEKHSTHPVTHTLQNLNSDGRAYWWADNSIIPALLGEATDKQWILRVPDHGDADGSTTAYHHTIDIEGGEADDQGAFRMILNILSMEGSRY